MDAQAGSKKGSGRKRGKNNKSNKMSNKSNKESSKDVKRQVGAARRRQDEEDLIFEDPFEDDMDEEAQAGDMMEDEAMDDEKAGDAQAPQQRVFRPGVDALEEDEQLDYDSSAYLLFHRMRVEWPCLSFAVLRDALPDFRYKFPHTCYLALGTQAQQANQNKVMLLKVSELHKTQHDDDDDEGDSESDEDDLDDDAVVEEKSFKHDGCVNRIRAMPQMSNLLATWSESGKVYVWDARQYLGALDKPQYVEPNLDPVFTFEGHSSEGYAIDWSRVVDGRLLTGDCHKHIYLWEPAQATWSISRVPFQSHSSSVEDLQWSPNEPNVFASCSSDKTVRIWDTRVQDRSMLWIAAHKTDVNVISWNSKVPHLLASGADDGSAKIWDLRNFKSSEPAAHFKWHKAAVSSIEWHTIDESMLVMSSRDHTVTVWDMALEEDPDASASGASLEGVEIPPQLVFVHQGQQDVKEVHFHPQIPSLIISTGLDGINIFKPANMEDEKPNAVHAGNPVEDSAVEA